MSPTTFLETLNALSLATDDRSGQAGRGGEVSRNRPDIRLQFPVPVRFPKIWPDM